MQSEAWEAAGRSLLDGVRRPGARPRALDIGCGPLGWLRILSSWVGPGGVVVGTDISTQLLATAEAFVGGERLTNVTLLQDDLFNSGLRPQSFDLVHARFQLAPLGWEDEQLEIYRRLVKPNGWLVVEEPDSSSWSFEPAAPATERLIRLVLKAFRAAGGDFDGGGHLRLVSRRRGYPWRSRDTFWTFPRRIHTPQPPS